MLKTSLIRYTIIDILETKKKMDGSFLMHKRYIQFVEELLGKKITTPFKSCNLSSLVNVKTDKISKRDIRILKEYLDYLNIVEN